MKISFFLLFSCALASVAAIGEIPPTNIAVAQPLSNARSDANGNGCSYAGGRTITNYPPNYPCPSAVGTAGGAFPATGSASTPNPFLGGFLDVTIADASDNSNPPFSDMVDMSFTDNTNELFVATKPGYAFRIDLTTGERSVFMDLTAQTTNSGDRGLSHIITHPDFKNNPYVYLSYSVNPKPGTDGNAINANEVTWQRIIRVTKNSNNQVADGSTIVILGQDATNGIPICFNSHMGGGMVFGHDGSLFIATGDGAHSDNITAGDYGQVMPGTSDYDPQCKVLFGDQAAGSFRAQMLDSISGKVLRIDPTTGDGICSSSQGYKVLNPYCSNNAKDARSKVWAMGLRHPWTTTLKPLQSGEDQDSPGTIYVGDVGFVSYEEINAVERGGNYGWPCWEGPLPTPSFRDSALDPLTNENGYLTRVYNGSQAINCAWMYKNVKTDMPFYYYSRYDESGGLANYDNGYLGQNVKGTCVGGLAFYNSDSYPAQYKNSLFFVDFGALWVKVLFTDANNQVNKVQDFQTYSLAMISLQNNPQGDICYLINQGGIHCIQYDASVIAPYTYAAATPTSGPGPLTVQFSSDGSYDRANHPVTFIWSFGDGSNATTLPNPVHTFTRDGTYTVTLTGINDAGKYQNKTVTINVGPNFSTPFINMTIVGEGFTQIAVSDKLSPLTATPEDLGSGFPLTPTAYGNWKFYDGINTNQLTFSASTNVANPKIRWEAQTVHTNHIHPDTIVKETAGFSADAISLVASGHSQERANVRLLVTVTDENGNQDTAQMFFLAAQRLFWKEYVQHPPTPQVVVNGTSFSQYQPVIFDARTSYDVDTDFLFYTWYFGDGVTATDNFVSHAYSAPGTYEVRMVMNDNYMGFTEWKTTITVNAAPLPSIPILPEDGAETKSSISPTGLATSGSNNGPNDGGVVSQSETQFTSGVEKVFPSILVAVLVLCLLIQ